MKRINFSVTMKNYGLVAFLVIGYTLLFKWIDANDTRGNIYNLKF